MTNTPRYRDLFSRRGNVTILAAVSLVAVFGVTGLVIDGGQMLAERRHAQNAADAAALAAAIDLFNGKTAAQAKITALAYAAHNGYSNDTSTNTVTVNIPPTSGAGVGNNDAVEVLATRKVTTYLIRIVYPDAAQVSRRAVAEMKKAPPGAALLLLNPASDSRLKFSGNAKINVNNGAIVVNSNGTKAVDGSGSAEVSASSILVSGGYAVSGSAKISGPVTTGATPMADPLSSLPAVNPSDLVTRSTSKFSPNNGTHTLQPGRYIGGIDLGGNAKVTLQPGIYYMDDGDLIVGGGADLVGDGVMIFAEQKVVLSGNGNIQLTAISGGTYDGMVLFGSRSATGSEFDISGTGDLDVQGTVYAPKHFVKLSGNGDNTNVGSRVIADWLEVTGSGTFNLDYDGPPGAGINGVYLLE